MEQQLPPKAAEPPELPHASGVLLHPLTVITEEPRRPVMLARSSRAAAPAAPVTPAPATMGKPQPRIPRIIHQTWKTHSVPDTCRKAVASWRSLNPGHEFRFYSDTEAEQHITRHHPELRHAFERMKPIERADLFRYVILYDMGGVYADMDVSCYRPVSEWGPHSGVLADPQFIAGFEMVTTRPDWQLWYAKQFQLCQWTMASAPRHEILRRLLESIQQYFATFDFRDKLLSIMFTTGPGVWSRVIQSYLKEQYAVELGVGLYPAKRAVNDFVAIADDVLLLPMRSFAINSGGYQLDYSAGHVEADVFVRHGFLGSWKEDAAVDKAVEKRFHEEAPDTEDVTLLHCALTTDEESVCCRKTECTAPSLAVFDGNFTSAINVSWLQFQTGAPVVLQRLSISVAPAVAFNYSASLWRIKTRAEPQAPWQNVPARLVGPLAYELSLTEPHRYYALELVPPTSASYSVVPVVEVDFYPRPRQEPDCLRLSDGMRVCGCCGMSPSTNPLSHVVDGLPATKWVVQRRRPRDIWVSFEFLDPVNISAYAVTSASDIPPRDPLSWDVFASRAPAGPWLLLDHRHASFTSRSQQVKTALPSGSLAGPWHVVKIVFNGPSAYVGEAGRWCFQLGELQLF